jgi:hypothetical protein
LTVSKDAVRKILVGRIHRRVLIEKVLEMNLGKDLGMEVGGKGVIKRMIGEGEEGATQAVEGVGDMIEGGHLSSWITDGPGTMVKQENKNEIELIVEIIEVMIETLIIEMKEEVISEEEGMMVIQEGTEMNNITRVIEMVVEKIDVVETRRLRNNQLMLRKSRHMLMAVV